MGHIPHGDAVDKALRAFLRKKKAPEAFALLSSDLHFTTDSDPVLDHQNEEFEPYVMPYHEWRRWKVLQDIKHGPRRSGFQFIRELARRFHLVPAHAKAFGWPDLDDLQVTAIIERLNRARYAYVVAGDIEGVKAALHDIDLKVLRKAYFARQMLTVDQVVLDYVSMSEDALARLAETDTGYLRAMHLKLRPELHREFLAHDPRESGHNVRLKNLYSVVFQPLPANQETDFLKAVSPERRVRRLKSRQRGLSMHLSQVLELVGEHKGKAARKYASAVEIDAFRQRRAKAEEWALDREMIDKATGESVGMHFLVETRRKAQLSQMYAVCKGMQGVADLQGWDYCMITLTLPGEWHSARTGTASKRQTTWNGSTPDEAARELQARWNRVATRIKQIVGKSGGLGFAIREPHEDGTVHLHLSMMAPREKLVAVRRYVIDQCAAAGETVDPDENPADVFQTTTTKLLHFLAWQPAEEMEDGKKAASPASYMFKYLSKGLASEDVSAWKACVGIRQVSWINFGPGFVSKWQAFYRVSRQISEEVPADEVEDMPTDPDMRAIVEDMAAKEWTSVVGALTGILEGPTLHAIRAERVTQYREVQGYTVGYANDDGEFVMIKDDRRSWTLQRCNRAEYVDEKRQHDDKRRQQAEAAATRVMSEIMSYLATLGKPVSEGVERAGSEEGFMTEERT